MLHFTISRYASPRGGFLFLPRLPLFELARVLVRYYHVASFIVNANHGAMCTAIELRISNRIRGFRNGWKCAARSGKFGFGCRASWRFSRK